MEFYGADRRMPDEEGIGDLVHALLTVGPVTSGGMGPTVVSWSELKAWCDMTGRHLWPWQACAIIEASRAWLAQYRASDGRPSPEPMSEADSE